MENHNSSALLLKGTTASFFFLHWKKYIFYVKDASDLCIFQKYCRTMALVQLCDRVAHPNRNSVPDIKVKPQHQKHLVCYMCL